MRERLIRLREWILPSPPEEAGAWFVHAVTATCALWLSVRGGIILVFNEFYTTQDAFKYMNMFPFAPSSWGWFFMVLGGMLLGSVIYGMTSLIKWLSITSAVMCTAVGTIFIVSSLDGNMGAVYTALNWFGIAMLFFSRYVVSLRWKI